MIEKKLWVRLLAYNLIRLLMAQAAVDHGIEPRARKRRPKSFQWPEIQRYLVRQQIKRFGDLLNPAHA